MNHPDELPIVVIDAKGYWWRVWGENPTWSMVPTNSDNSDVPRPVKFYRLVEIPQKLRSHHTDDCAVWEHYQCSCSYGSTPPGASA